ncbi:MAG: lipoprotein signal peptidase [Bacteroidales bacterium]|nr:lipoprotein signal peptidase [Bacteroidales bacterium]MBR1949554.1 lipoprotein signal peptidase [Bacteroidales bacterium]MBR2437448.1 lipoprotein signal peptidase [Bacteroidales bacterium]MBR4088956.1 lipoprotein signal peptidase [Bacteroidales bacterium]
MKFTKGGCISLFVVLLLVIDQAIKFAVKLNMTIGESIPVFGDWFQICFIENNGMAFGMQFGGSIGKLALSLFRVVLIGFIIVYLRKLIKRAGTPTGVLVGLSLVLVGAIGNVIDCLFYGEIFSASTYTQVAQLFPPDGGYTGFLYGKVVDMFYFPIIDTVLPEWVPFYGGEPFIFFRPIFNFADACISCAVVYMLLFQRKFFTEEK